MTARSYSLVLVSILMLATQLRVQLSAQSAQTPEKPEVGKRMPDFSLPLITHYPKTSATRDDFKGNWLVLDFWYLGCTTSISSLPAMSKIQEEYKDKLTWMMVGINNRRYGDIANVYEKMRASYNLELPSAYDSVLAKKWGIHSVPHIIIIDPHGTVAAITPLTEISSTKINDLINGRPVTFANADTPRLAFNPRMASADEQVVFQSVLTHWKGEQQYPGTDIDKWLRWRPEERKEGFKLAMVPLYALYNFAYIGKWNWYYGDSLYNTVLPRPIIELRDTTAFTYSYKATPKIGLYNYNLRLPEHLQTKEMLMNTMKQDLARCFPYAVSIEKRTMPVWKLVASSQAQKLLTSKGGEPYITKESKIAGFTMRNFPASKLLSYIAGYLAMDDMHVRFVDRSGLSGSIDITVDANMRKMEEVQKAIEQYGLRLIKGEEEINVIVIRDFPK